MRRFPWFTIVAHFLWRFVQPRYSIGAVGVVIRSDGQVLLVKHVFHPKTPWGLPGGWAGSQETPADTVKREIHEELSLGVVVGPLLLVEAPRRNHLDFAYLCTPDGPIGNLSFELDDHRWYDCENLPRLLPFHGRAIEQAFHQLKEYPRG